MRVSEIISHIIKPKPPMTPAQTRVAGLKRNVEQDKQKLRQERDRQRQQRSSEQQRKQRIGLGEAAL